MTLWLIYHPIGTFEDDASKRALSADITKMYISTGLPAFYVIVNFITLPGTSTYIGSRPNTSERLFIRISVEHIAVKLPDSNNEYLRARNGIDRALKPHVADKGYNWESHVDETERRLWRVQGMDPPGFGSEGERVWQEANRAVPLERM